MRMSDPGGDPSRLDGKAVVVTGAGQGIGRDIAILETRPTAENQAMIHRLSPSR